MQEKVLHVDDHKGRPGGFDEGMLARAGEGDELRGGGGHAVGAREIVDGLVGAQCPVVVVIAEDGGIAGVERTGQGSYAVGGVVELGCWRACGGAAERDEGLEDGGGTHLGEQLLVQMKDAKEYGIGRRPPTPLKSYLLCTHTV